MKLPEPVLPTAREQKLVDIMFSCVALASDPQYSVFQKMSLPDRMAWVAEQLRGCGFDTTPCGASWGDTQVMLQFHTDHDTFFWLVGSRVESALDHESLFLPSGDDDFFVTLSVKGDEVHGVHVYVLHKENEGLKLGSCLTWVDKKFRGAGIAKKMWRYSLQSAPVTSVEACMASWEGSALIRSLQRRFPSLKWDTYASYEHFE